MSEFIPGLKLGGLFYREAVRPILDDSFPDLPHTAAMIGSGSEILGFDTLMSSDHHWGPRVMLFINEDNFSGTAERIRETLAHKLPYTFHGYSTHFSSPDPNDNGVQLLQTIDSGAINHRVEILTVRGFFKSYLDIEPYGEIEAADWLTFTEQRLRTVTGGAVYQDGLKLEAIRARLVYYPRDVWLYLLAAGWGRIGQEEPFVGRTGSVGDETGSQVIAARLVRDVMRLCFLMERQYAPYSKWFGTAFSRLGCAPTLTPILRRVMLAEDWHTREESLAQAYTILAGMHNALGITEPLPTEVSSFFGRPFMVIHGGSFTEAIKAQIQDEAVKRIPADIGGIDQFSDSTDLLENVGLRRRLKALYA